jgi:ABC-type dipeptide/oligopeptide/nickel transport system permease subunit
MSEASTAVLSRRPLARAGIAVFLLLACTALLAPVLTSPGDRESGDPFQHPSRLHPLGTDDIGHDLLAMLLHGGRSS